MKIMHNYFSRTGFSAIDPSSFSLNLELEMKLVEVLLLGSFKTNIHTELFENL